MSLIKKYFFVFILFLTIFASCKKSTPQVSSFFCSVENVKDASILADSNKSVHFQGFDQICDTVHFSGKNSLYTNPQFPFAFTTEIKISNDGIYNLSFWQKGGNDSVYAVLQYDTLLYENSSQIVDSNKFGWKKVSLTFNLNKKFTNKRLKLYVWNSSSKTVFVDDFSLKAVEMEELGLSDTIFWMYVDSDAAAKLEAQRQKAFKNGVLTSDGNSWIKSMALWGNDTYKIKMRLKGDWLDHIQGDKWSFRIKIKNEKAFKGMKVFSIQNPKTRHFLDQWFLYTLFRSQDLLAPRYGFIYGKKNDKFLGIYAYEEHFEKQVLESLNHREGPILKFTEDSFWDLVIENNKNEKWLTYPLFEASKIVPFFQGKTIKSKTLNAEFNIAKNLVYQHKYGLAKVSDLFDVDQAARFFALINVMQAYHGLRWHNQRFYYNPVTSKLEFVDYDNYIGGGVYKLTGRIIFGEFNKKGIPQKPESILNYYLFSDTLFVKNYIKYLKKYSDKSFWDSVFTVYDQQLYYYEKMLNKEYADYHFDKNLYYSQAKLIRNNLSEYIKKVNSGLYDNIKLPYRENKFYNSTNVSSFLVDYVKVFIQSKNRNELNLKIINYYPSTITVLGYISDGKKYTINKLSIPAYNTSKNEKELTISSNNIDYLIVSDGKTESQIEVLPWSEPIAWSPRQELENNNKFPNEPFYKLSGKKVIFSGKQTISNFILIPSGYNVVFKAGTDIDFVDGGGFMSNSNVQILGNKSNPVKIHSSDKSARGFSVIQAKNVDMQYAIFDGLNTFKYKAWELTGAITIYEANVKIDNCKFINNQCEDDLNTVRCVFDVTNTLFENTFSDAFDSDFSKGKVDKCTFMKLGNDAIDFSTSTVLISNCAIKNAMDKGVSGGEASHLTIKNCTIDGANIAIASKDKTVLYLSDLQLSNAAYGLAVFQKKPEYGEAKIFAERIKSTNIVQFSLIEKGSLLQLDGLKIEGKVKNVAKMFY